MLKWRKNVLHSFSNLTCITLATGLSYISLPLDTHFLENTWTSFNNILNFVYNPRDGFAFNGNNIIWYMSGDCREVINPLREYGTYMSHHDFCYLYHCYRFGFNCFAFKTILYKERKQYKMIFWSSILFYRS